MVSHTPKKLSEFLLLVLTLSSLKKVVIGLPSAPIINDEVTQIKMGSLETSNDSKHMNLDQKTKSLIETNCNFATGPGLLEIRKIYSSASLEKQQQMTQVSKKCVFWTVYQSIKYQKDSEVLKGLVFDDHNGLEVFPSSFKESPQGITIITEVDEKKSLRLFDKQTIFFPHHTWGSKAHELKPHHLELFCKSDIAAANYLKTGNFLSGELENFDCWNEMIRKRRVFSTLVQRVLNLDLFIINSTSIVNFYDDWDKKKSPQQNSKRLRKTYDFRGKAIVDRFTITSDKLYIRNAFVLARSKIVYDFVKQDKKIKIRDFQNSKKLFHLQKIDAKNNVHLAKVGWEFFKAAEAPAISMELFYGLMNSETLRKVYVSYVDWDVGLKTGIFLTLKEGLDDFCEQFKQSFSWNITLEDGTKRDACLNVKLQDILSALGDEVWTDYKKIEVNSKQ